MGVQGEYVMLCKTSNCFMRASPSVFQGGLPKRHGQRLRTGQALARPRISTSGEGAEKNYHLHQTFNSFRRSSHEAWLQL